MKKIIALVGLLCLAVSAVYASVWADVQITGYSQRKEAADKVAERLDFEQKVALSLKAADSKVQEDIAAMKKAAGQKELSLEQQAQIEHKRAIYALNALVGYKLLDQSFVDDFSYYQKNIQDGLMADGDLQSTFRALKYLVIQINQLNSKIMPKVKEIANHKYYVHVKAEEQLLSLNEAAALVNKETLCDTYGFPKWVINFYNIPKDMQHRDCRGEHRMSVVSGTSL
ncbi:MAG: hypothetical protein IKN49_00650 [Elusimicrobiaceae bacterium]|nr:hypothetical protein [Elusimicrobiaceae bacterium]